MGSIYKLSRAAAVELAAALLMVSLAGECRAFGLASVKAADIAAPSTQPVPGAPRPARQGQPRGVSQAVGQALSGSSFECRRFRVQPFPLPGGLTIADPDRLTVSFHEVSGNGLTVKAEAFKAGVGTMTRTFRIAQDVQEKYSPGEIVIFEGNNIGLDSALNGQYAIRTELHLHLDLGNRLEKIALEKGVFSGMNPLQKNEFTCEL